MMQQQAFDCAKQRVTEIPVLAQVDYDKIFKLTVDTSNEGLGLAISQHNDDGEDCPIAFYSGCLNPVERNYSTTEKELLVLV